MRKLASLLVLSVFLISIASAGYAHEVDRSSHLKERLEKAREKVKDRVSDAAKIKDLTESQLKVVEKVDARFKSKLDKLNKEKVEKFSKLPPVVAKRLVKEADFEGGLGKFAVRQVAKSEIARAFVKREIAADKLKNAEEKLKTARGKFEKARAGLKERKDEFKKTKTLEDAKAYLTKVLDALMERVNKLKARAEGSKDLSEDQSRKALDDLGDRLTKLNEWKLKVEDAKTKEELKDVLKGIVAEWRHLDHMLKVHGWRAALEHFGGLLRQAEHLDNRLNKWLTLSEKNNVTISNKESKVSEIQGKLADSRKSFESSVSDFKQLKELVQNKSENVTDAQVSQRKSLADSMQNNLKEAKNSLKGARELLVNLAKDIVKKIRGADATTDSGKPVEAKEEDILDPAKAVEGVDVEEGKSTVEIVEEETLDL